MANNVLTWNGALTEGFEPRQYPYAAGQVPEGEYDVILDKKIWAKNTVGINCYCTILDTGQKIQLTVYCRRLKSVYEVAGSPIDFASCPLHTVYHVTVHVNAKKRVVLEKAALVEPAP